MNRDVVICSSFGALSQCLQLALDVLRTKKTTANCKKATANPNPTDDLRDQGMLVKVGNREVKIN